MSMLGEVTPRKEGSLLNPSIPNTPTSDFSKKQYGV
jgi:hypothetical protein